MGIVGCPCGCDDCSTSGEDAAKMVRDWIERRKFKPGALPSPEVLAELEQCADDLEV